MPISCQITRNPVTNQIDTVKAPNGEPSRLFSDALDLVKNPQEAFDIWGSSFVEEFEDTKTSVEVDENGEPHLEQVLDFIEWNRNVPEITPEDRVGIKNVLRLKDINNTSELRQELDKVLPHGVLNQNALSESSFFTTFEKSQILKDPEVLNNLKDLKVQLMNMDTEIVSEESFDSDYLLINTEESTKWGFQKILNPDKVRQDIAEMLAGIRNRDEFDSAINQIDYDSIKERYFEDDAFADKMFQDFSNMDKVEVKHINEFGELEDVAKPNRTTEAEIAMNLDNTDFTRMYGLLSQFSDDMWETSKTEIRSFLRQAELEGERAGVNLSGLADKIASRQDVVSLLRTLSELEVNQTSENLNSFLDTYDSFFEVEYEPNIKISDYIGVPVVEVKSPKTEYEMYRDYGLVKMSEGRYVQTENKTVEEYKAEMQDSVKYVADNLSAIETQGEFDYDTAERLLLEKRSRGFVENKNAILETRQAKNLSKISNSSEDIFFNYPAEFQRQKLEAHRKNDSLRSDFYDNFNITEQGIELNTEGDITISDMREILPQVMTENQLKDFQDYLSVTKNEDIKDLFNDDVNEPYYPTLKDERVYFQNNMDAMPNYQGEFEPLGDTGIVTKDASDMFVKVDDKLYQLVNEEGNLGFYREIPSYNEDYNVVDDLDIVNKFSYSEINPYIRTSIQLDHNVNISPSQEVNVVEKEFFECL